jgi:hypothetical protein
VKLKRGSTSVRRYIFIGDSSSTTGAGLANLVFNSAGLVAYYIAGDLSNEVQITLATATLGSYTSGGFIAVDNTNMPGWYEIGIPDAALDAGNEVAIQFRGATNMVPVNIYIELDAFDYQTATQPVNVTQISGDATAADTLELFAEALDQATGQIDSGTLAASAITAASIAADAITDAKIATGAFTSDKFDAGSLDGKGDWNVGKTGYSLTPTTGLGNQTADITGSLSGSVGSVVGAVGSVTGNVGGNVTGSVGSVVGAVGSVTAGVTVATIGANVITATSIQDNAITAAKIANGAIDAATFAADVDAEILSYIVDDATRIDASALNTASGTTVPAIATEVGKIPRGASAIAAGGNATKTKISANGTTLVEAIT